MATRKTTSKKSAGGRKSAKGTQASARKAIRQASDRVKVAIKALQQAQATLSDLENSLPGGGPNIIDSTNK
jgi:hypothetical protein